MSSRIHKFSEQMIEFGERLGNVADAAEGKRPPRGRGGRSKWVLLPAAGAGLYALVTSEFFTRQTKGVVGEAKTLASDLPDDLMKSVRRHRRGHRRASVVKEVIKRQANIAEVNEPQREIAEVIYAQRESASTAGEQ